MITHSYTAVLERNVRFANELTTEPYEVAWAREARIFVRALDLVGEIEATVEISPDGLFWIPEGSSAATLDRPGVLSFAVREFGHWLRVVLRNRSAEPSARVIIYLALKE